MRRRSWIAGVAIGVLLATGAVVHSGATPASADTYGGCYNGATEGCIPDNYRHTWCFATSMDDGPRLRAAALYAMLNLQDQTRYTAAAESCGAGTDILFTRSRVINARGEYICLNRRGDVCYQAAVQLNPDQLHNRLNRRKTACHEVGHSVGLQHGRDKSDCMISGHITSGHQRYSCHHIRHANNRGGARPC